MGRCDTEAGLLQLVRIIDLLARHARIELPAAIVARLDGGPITEDRGYYDPATMISRLGLDNAATTRSPHSRGFRV